MSIWEELLKGFMQGMSQTAAAGEKKVVGYFYQMKKALFRFAAEVILTMLGIVLVTAGIVMLLSRFIAIEWILLVTGLLMLNAVLLTAKFK